MVHYKCLDCNAQMSRHRMPQVCDYCLTKGGSGADPDYNSKTRHEYGDLYTCFDEDDY